MNATEDGMEPVGEAPYLGGNTFGSPIQDRRHAAIAEIRRLATRHEMTKSLWTAFTGLSSDDFSNFSINSADIIAILDKWGV